MQSFAVACAQFACVPLDVDCNVRRAAEWVRRAVDETGAQLVVLPETASTGFAPAPRSPSTRGEGAAGRLWDLVDTLPGAVSEPIQRAAQELRTYVVMGTYERQSPSKGGEGGAERGLLYNSAFLAGPNGDLLGIYRKTHLFPTERIHPAGDGGQQGGWSTPGNEPVVVETPLANIGLTICYDGDFPELYRVEAILGAEIIVRPSALLRSFEIWELTNRARAYDNHVYIAACNAVGPDAGGNYYFGHSMIVDPIAHKLAQARGTEEIVSARLDPDPIKRVTYGATTPMLFEHLADRNLAAYQNILAPARSRFEPARSSEAADQ